MSCKNPGKCKVILVEDEPTLALVLGMQLEDANIDFCAASNGFKALELIKSHRPKVLLLDVSLPGMSGFEVVENMRQDPALALLGTMHLVVHTSHDLSEKEKESLSFGEAHYLTKTKMAEDLPVFVKRLLDSTQD